MKSKPSLSVPLAALDGTYRNLGYDADIEICGASSPSPHSCSCASLVAKLITMFPAEIAAADLVWARDKIVVSYVTLSHFEGPLFNATGWLAVGMVAEFDIESAYVVGVGIQGEIWVAWVRGDGDPLEGEPQCTTVEERSEVWYKAIKNKA
ncbi:hypothetical protein DFH09DRAFT_1070651 [Mycena vulgaris]|nr:hypothetical protein DFH09DRAFT_1070651 [Mycena vulgaris]